MSATGISRIHDATIRLVTEVKSVAIFEIPKRSIGCTPIKKLPYCEALPTRPCWGRVFLSQRGNAWASA